MISGGTLQSSAEAIGGEGAEALTDPAALIVDPELAAAVRSRSPIPLAPRFNARGDVLAPMTPAAFINPAVIHRTMALLAADRGAEAEPVPLPRGGHPTRRRRQPAAALRGGGASRRHPGRLRRR